MGVYDKAQVKADLPARARGITMFMRLCVKADCQLRVWVPVTLPIIVAAGFATRPPLLNDITG